MWALFWVFFGSHLLKKVAVSGQVNRGWLFAGRNYNAACMPSAMFVHLNILTMCIHIYVKDEVKLCIILHSLKLKEIDQRSFLLNLALKPYCVPLCGRCSKCTEQ